MAAFEARQERTDQQIAELGRQLRSYAETQSEFIQIVTRSIEALTESQQRTDERLNRTDERLNRLAVIVERHIVEGHGGS